MDARIVKQPISAAVAGTSTRVVQSGILPPHDRPGSAWWSFFSFCYRTWLVGVLRTHLGSAGVGAEQSKERVSVTRPTTDTYHLDCCYATKFKYQDLQKIEIEL